MRIGLERTAEELIRDLAILAEARASVWDSPSEPNHVRVEMRPTRPGAKYRLLKLNLALHSGRASGRMEVFTPEGPAEPYEVDLRLGDRRETRDALWGCLSKYLDLSGQLPIPADGHSTSVESLPQPLERPFSDRTR